MRAHLAGGALIILGAVLLGGASSVPAQSRDIRPESTGGERRLALVIGNNAYAGTPLRNPVNDARAMAEALGALGFEVILRQDATEKQMKRAIDEFGDRLRRGGVGLVFYAGHGIQMGGRNYLIPVDAKINSERDVDIESVDVNRVLARMEEARNRLNIVILDACRNNPFTRSFRSPSPGLVPIDAPSGTLIAYATAPGRLASDGEDRNGLYTAELLRAMREPGLRLEDVFKRARSAVRRRTNGEQVPWESSSIEGEFVFTASGIASAAPLPSPSQPGAGDRIRAEFGSLAITSGVAGADVWLGERKLGITKLRTPLMISDVPAGRQWLTARKHGFIEWEHEVEVLPNQRTSVTINLARHEQLLVLAPNHRSEERTTEIVAPGNGLHRFNIFLIDVTAFQRGGLYIDIEIDQDSPTNGSFDLFLEGTPIPTRGSGPPGSVAGAHGLVKGRKTTIAYEITRGQVFSFGLEGDWYSPEGNKGIVRFRARVETP